MFFVDTRRPPVPPLVECFLAEVVADFGGGLRRHHHVQLAPLCALADVGHDAGIADLFWVRPAHGAVLDGLEATAARRDQIVRQHQGIGQQHADDIVGGFCMGVLATGCDRPTLAWAPWHIDGREAAFSSWRGCRERAGMIAAHPRP